MPNKYWLQRNSLNLSESGSSNGLDQKKDMIVVFDTECILCSRAVDFVLKREVDEKITFVAGTSVHAEVILVQFAELCISPNETLLVLSEGRLLSRSSAAIKIASHLRFPWNLAIFLHILPVRLRDNIYRKIARERYHWFGHGSCYVPSEKNRHRFLL